MSPITLSVSLLAYVAVMLTELASANNESGEWRSARLWQEEQTGGFGQLYEDELAIVTNIKAGGRPCKLHLISIVGCS